MKTSGPLKIHTTPPTVQRTADLPTRTDEHVAHDQGETPAEAKAETPRRVGPLRKIHMATLERAASLAQPLLEQLAEVRRRVNAINSQAIDDVLEDLGQPTRGQDEDARLVEEGGETYVVLSPASARLSPRQAPPAQAPKAPKAT